MTLRSIDWLALKVWFFHFGFVVTNQSINRFVLRLLFCSAHLFPNESRIPDLVPDGSEIFPQLLVRFRIGIVCDSESGQQPIRLWHWTCHANFRQLRSRLHHARPCRSLRRIGQTHFTAGYAGTVAGHVLLPRSHPRNADGNLLQLFSHGRKVGNETN